MSGGAPSSLCHSCAALSAFMQNDETLMESLPP
jgi:hypothetical protein